MSVTLMGIVTPVTPEQPAKAFVPMMGHDLAEDGAQRTGTKRVVVGDGQVMFRRRSGS